MKKLAKTAADLRGIDGMDTDQALFVAADLLGLNMVIATVTNDQLYGQHRSGRKSRAIFT